jgi:transcription initiation factor TFIIH subunit 1
MYTSLSELLRHFWSCFPPTTTALEEKLQRTHETIQKFKSVKMQQLSERMLRDHLSAGQLLSHSTSMIDAAEAKYNNWQNRTRR